jgi:hypothetical protein
LRIEIYVYSDFIPNGLLKQEVIQSVSGQHPSDTIQNAIDKLEEMKNVVRN